MTKVKFTKLHRDAKLPRRWSSGTVGYDLCAYLLTEDSRPTKRVVAPNYTVSINTGVSVEVPPSHFLLICPRPDLQKHSISVSGIIDHDHSGEVQVFVHNGSYTHFWVEHEMRIAQLILMPMTPMSIIEVEPLHALDR